MNWALGEVSMSPNDATLVPKRSHTLVERLHPYGDEGIATHRIQA